VYLSPDEQEAASDLGHRHWHDGFLLGDDPATAGSFRRHPVTLSLEPSRCSDNSLYRINSGSAMFTL
jgi:hypothetical protein